MVVKTLVYPALLRQAEISMMVAAIVSKGTLGPQECFIHKGNAVSMLFQCLLDCVLFFGGGLGWEELHQFYPKQWSPWRWCTSNRAETPTVHWANQPWTDAVSWKKTVWNYFLGEPLSLPSTVSFERPNPIVKFSSGGWFHQVFFSVTTQKMPTPPINDGKPWWLQNYPWNSPSFRHHLSGWNTPYKY